MQKISENRKKVAQPFILKRLVVGRGHDCGGLIADVYFRGQLVATYHDDGWGGEPEVRFESDELEKEVKDYLKEKNYAQLMFNNGWQFMKKVEKIDADTQFHDIVETKSMIILEEKTMKKIQRACKSKIVFGTTYNYSELSWKGVKSLDELVKHYGQKGVLVIQKAYDRAKSESQKIDGAKVFNDAKQLKELGIVL